jgi:hypothetical protein
MFRSLTLLLPLVLLACTPSPPEVGGRPTAVTRPRVFVSPMGAPFRTARDQRPPLDTWFLGVDRDDDGRIVPAEMAADASGFFNRLDVDGNNALDPGEVTAYELVTPELRAVSSGPPPGMPPGGGGMGGAGSPRAMPMLSPDMQGAARFGLLAIPHPVASTDTNLDRTISRAEFIAAAHRRFAVLDPANSGALTLPALHQQSRKRAAPGP